MVEADFHAEPHSLDVEAVAGAFRSAAGLIDDIATIRFRREHLGVVAALVVPRDFPPVVETVGRVARDEAAIRLRTEVLVHLLLGRSPLPGALEMIADEPFTFVDERWVASQVEADGVRNERRLILHRGPGPLHELAGSRALLRDVGAAMEPIGPGPYHRFLPGNRAGTKHQCRQPRTQRPQPRHHALLLILRNGMRRVGSRKVILRRDEQIQPVPASLPNLIKMQPADGQHLEPRVPDDPLHQPIPAIRVQPPKLVRIIAAPVDPGVDVPKADVNVEGSHGWRELYRTVAYGGMSREALSCWV